MDGWKTLLSQELQVELNYPDPTPDGFEVLIHERGTDTSYRAHLISEGSDEVYFEVGVYQNLPARQAVELFLVDVSQRIEQLQAKEVRETTFAGFPAYQFSIQWPGKERIIIFIDRGDILYRIIHDPVSPINKKILENIQFLRSNKS